MQDWRFVPWTAAHLGRVGVHLTYHIITSQRDGLISTTAMLKKPTMAETERGQWFYLYSRLLGDVWLTIYVIGKGDRLTAEYVKDMLYSWFKTSPRWVRVNLDALGSYTEPSRPDALLTPITDDQWERILKEFANGR